MKKEILNEIFKGNDIRGLTPSQLDEKFFELLGKAYVTKFSPKKVFVGHDIRPESYLFKQYLIKGFLESGTDVIDLGEIATEMLYFAVGEHYHIVDGGIVVTASHNPSGWNGCKIVTRNARAVGKLSGLDDIKNIILEDKYTPLKKTKGTYEDFFIYPAYKEKVLSFITAEQRKPLKLIVDAGNGIGGRIFDYVFDPLNIDVDRLYFVPDGKFPNHVPDPLKEENVTEIKKEVLSQKADLGIAIDGDADRVFFIDKKGRKPDGVYTGVIIAREILRNSYIKKIIHDPRVTWPFEKEAAKLDATTVTSIAGHSYVQNKMAEEDAVFGAEQSAHLYYRDFYNSDSGMVTIAHILNMYYEGLNLTEAVDYLFETYPNSGEINYKIRDKAKKLTEVEKHYKKYKPKISRLDGVSIEFTDWRFNLRESKTQPLLRLNIEGVNKDIIVEKYKELDKLIDAEKDNIPTLEELR